jgi:DNA-binding NarL/FixJ family response regulator
MTAALPALGPACNGRPAMQFGTRTRRVLVFDTAPIFRAGVRATLSSAHELGAAVVGEGSTVDEMRALIERSSPEIVAVDAAMIESQQSWLRTFRRIAPQTRVLVVASHDDFDLSQEFLAVRVDGYIIRDDPPEILIAAIQALLAGETYVSPRVPPLAADGDSRIRKVSSLERLSKREREVFHMFVQGYTSPHVAHELHLSVKTVQTHRARINRKLGVHSAAELLRFAALRGLVQP